MLLLATVALPACGDDPADVGGAGGAGATSGSTTSLAPGERRLEILFEGSGKGTVRVEGTSIACTEDCVVPFAGEAVLVEPDVGSSVGAFAECNGSFNFDRQCSGFEGDGRVVARIELDGPGFPRRLGGSDLDLPLAVARGKDGRVYAGLFVHEDQRDTFDVDAVSAPLGADYGAALVALDQDARPIWSRAVGAEVNGIDEFATGTFAVAVDADGHVFAAGYAGRKDLDGNAAPSGLDSFVAKLDPNGKTVWSTFVPGFVRSLEAAGDGGVVIGGGGRSSFDFAGEPACSPAPCLYAARLSAKGEPLWARGFETYGDQSGPSKADEAFYGIARTPEGDFVLAGSVNTGYSGTCQPNYGGVQHVGRGYLDVLVAELGGEDGAIAWTRLVGSAAPNYARGVAVDPAGHATVLVVGVGHGSEFGGGPLAQDQDSQIALARYDAAGAHLASRGFPFLATGLGISGEDAVVAGLSYGGSALDGIPLGGTAEFPSAFVARFGKSLGATAAKELGGSSVPSGTTGSLTVGPVDAHDGFAVVGGTFEGYLDLEGKTRASGGSVDAFVHATSLP